MLPLLILLVGLAVATAWYVALPAFDKQPRAQRACEVIVRTSGSTACVRDPRRGSQATSDKPKPSSRAKR